MGARLRGAALKSGDASRVTLASRARSLEAPQPTLWRARLLAATALIGLRGFPSGAVTGATPPPSGRLLAPWRAELTSEARRRAGGGSSGGVGLTGTVAACLALLARLAPGGVPGRKAKEGPRHATVRARVSASSSAAVLTWQGPLQGHHPLLELRRHVQEPRPQHLPQHVCGGEGGSRGLQYLRAERLGRCARTRVPARAPGCLLERTPVGDGLRAAPWAVSPSCTAIKPDASSWMACISAWCLPSSSRALVRESSTATFSSMLRHSSSSVCASSAAPCCAATASPPLSAGFAPPESCPTGLAAPSLEFGAGGFVLNTAGGPLTCHLRAGGGDEAAPPLLGPFRPTAAAAGARLVEPAPPDRCVAPALVPVLSPAQGLRPPALGSATLGVCSLPRADAEGRVEPGVATCAVADADAARRLPPFLGGGDRGRTCVAAAPRHGAAPKVEAPGTQASHALGVWVTGGRLPSSWCLLRHGSCEGMSPAVLGRRGLWRRVCRDATVRAVDSGRVEAKSCGGEGATVLWGARGTQAPAGWGSAGSVSPKQRRSGQSQRARRAGCAGHAAQTVSG